MEYYTLANGEFKRAVLKKLNKLQEISEKQLTELVKRYLNKMSNLQKRLRT